MFSILTLLSVCRVFAVFHSSSGVPSTEGHSAAPSQPSIGQGSPAPTVRSVELSFLKKVTNDFSIHNTIGRGGFSVVFEVSINFFG